MQNLTITCAMVSSSFRISCLFFCTFAFLSLSAKSQEWSMGWSRGDNFTMNSTYKANLDKILSILSSDDVIHGDNELKQHFPPMKESTIWLHVCLLRYSNESISGKLELTASGILTSDKNASNPNQYAKLTTLFNGLKDLAASGNSTFKFATGSANVSDSETLYALMQCIPDLSEAECNDCLSTATDTFQHYCKAKQDCRVITDNCELWYNNYQFYNTSAVQPPASPPSPAASFPPLANTAARKGLNMKTRIQILALLVSFFLFM